MRHIFAVPITAAVVIASLSRWLRRRQQHLERRHHRDRRRQRGLRGHLEDGVGSQRLQQT